MKRKDIRDLRALKAALKIWRASERKPCPLCGKDVKRGEIAKVVVGANRTLTKYYHMQCYIDRLKEEVKDYEDIRDLLTSEEEE